jgi:hypothetical protein
MKIALKTLTRQKKAPVVETIKSTFDTQVQQVAISNVNTLHNSSKLSNGVTLYINPEYDETSDEFAPDKTLQEWCNIKGISISDLANFDPANDITHIPNVSGITRVRLPKVSNATDICIITLGEFIKLIRNKIDYVSQTRLYYKKHEGFLPEGCIKREKDISGDTSYYSMLSCEPENIDKLKQYIKMNFRTDKVKWLS